MVFGIGNIVALVCIVISIVFAVVTHQADQRTLVGAFGNLRRAFVGRQSAVGQLRRDALKSALGQSRLTSSPVNF